MINIDVSESSLTVPALGTVEKIYAEPADVENFVADPYNATLETVAFGSLHANFLNKHPNQRGHYMVGYGLTPDGSKIGVEAHFLKRSFVGRMLGSKVKIYAKLKA